MRGKHADFNTVIDMISFAREFTEIISLGGGEPTLHPRFFDILRYALQDFDYVWMATNGSITKSMYRLSSIIENYDYESFDIEDYCSCDEEERDNCYCEPKGLISQEGKLSVALSLDCFHDPIDPRIENLWRRKANAHNRSHYEIRDVSRHVSSTGRAKKTGSGWEDNCVCGDNVLKINGDIRLCGCANSPVIGTIWSGIEDSWQQKMLNNDYQETNCCKSIKKER